jgi:hypothetical protein
MGSIRPRPTKVANHNAASAAPNCVGPEMNPPGTQVSAGGFEATDGVIGPEFVAVVATPRERGSDHLVDRLECRGGGVGVRGGRHAVTLGEARLCG